MNYLITAAEAYPDSVLVEKENANVVVIETTLDE